MIIKEMIYMYRINDWNTTLFIEKKWHYTHLTLEQNGKIVEIELDKYKLEELIKILNTCNK